MTQDHKDHLALQDQRVFRETLGFLDKMDLKDQRDILETEGPLVLQVSKELREKKDQLDPLENWDLGENQVAKGIWVNQGQKA